MNQMHRGMLIAAMTAAFVMGCGGGENPTDGGTMTGGCTSDSQCSTGKGCHPVLKECVETCSDNADCPASAKTCAKVASSASLFCTCSSDLLCNGNVVGNLVCNDATKQCTQKCSASNACPSGFTCNATSGNCDAAATDAGTDAGMGTACDGLGDCLYPEVCNFESGFCEAGKACTGANAQPDSCGYAGYCSSNNNCAQIDPPNCSNFSGSTFNPKTSKGPVIYYVETPAAGSTGRDRCTTSQFVHTFVVQAYRINRDWEATRDAEQDKVTFYPGSGSPISIGAANLPVGGYKANGRNVALEIQLCGNSAAALTAGFKFADGNEACAQSTGGIAGTGAP